MDFQFYTTLQMLIGFSGLVAITYFLANSPKRKAVAEIYKKKKLRELGLDEDRENRTGDLLLENMRDLKQRVDKLEIENDRLTDENRFLKKIAEKDI